MKLFTGNIHIINGISKRKFTVPFSSFDRFQALCQFLSVYLVCQLGSRRPSLFWEKDNAGLSYKIALIKKNPWTTVFPQPFDISFLGSNLSLLLITACWVLLMWRWPIWIRLFIGPWVVGEMMRGHLGALFVHGMYLKQHWIPGSLTYYYGIMQVREKSLIRLFGFFFLAECGWCALSDHAIWCARWNHAMCIESEDKTIPYKLGSWYIQFKSVNARFRLPPQKMEWLRDWRKVIIASNVTPRSLLMLCYVAESAACPV